MPDGQPSVPTVCIVISMEEPTREIIGPRLRLMGAAPGMVPYIPMKRDPNFPKDLPKLERSIVKTGAKLVVIDPFYKAIGSNYDTNNNQHASYVMKKFAEVAERLQVTFLFIHHLNKATGASGIYRSAGAISIVASARASIAVAKIPGTNQVAFIKYKSNYGLPGKPIAFETFSFPPPDQHLGGCKWVGSVNVEFDDLLGDLDTIAKMKRAQAPPKDEVMLWLEEYMDKQMEAPVEPELLYALGREMGYTKDAVTAARVKLGLRVITIHGKVPKIVWTKAARRPTIN